MNRLRASRLALERQAMQEAEIVEVELRVGYRSSTALDIAPQNDEASTITLHVRPSMTAVPISTTAVVAKQVASDSSQAGSAGGAVSLRGPAST